MRRSDILACGLAWALLAPAASATDTYVDFEFDRSPWEAAASGSLVTETFDTPIPQADTIVFDGGIESVASDPIGSPNHLVDGDRFVGLLRPASSSSDGYLTYVWTFPEPATAFGADFFSIGGTRQVSVQGTFDAGLEAFDLRALFTADGGVDQGFFGLTSTVPFSSITLIALGSSTNDAFTIDNVTIAVPEPGASGAGVAALLALAGLRRRRSRAR